MKAKQIAKIKSQMKYFDVWVTSPISTFGVSTYGEPKCTLLARNECEAAKRASRKGLSPENSFVGSESDARFGIYAVRLHNKLSERFTKYYE